MDNSARDVMEPLDRLSSARLSAAHRSAVVLRDVIVEPVPEKACRQSVEAPLDLWAFLLLGSPPVMARL